MLLDVSTQRKNSISITPLIDVVFILLLFFMLSSTFNPAKQIEINAAGGKSTAQITPTTVQTILLYSETEVRVNGIPISLNSSLLKEKLIGFANRNDPVVLAANSQVRVQSVIKLIDQIYDSGVKNLKISGSITP